MRVQTRGLLIDKAASATISAEYINSSCDSLGLQVYGTFTSATIKVQGVIDADSTEWVDIALVNLSDLSAETVGITEKGIYQVPIDALCKVRINVTAVSGGNISVYGQFADTANN